MYIELKLDLECKGTLRYLQEELGRPQADCKIHIVRRLPFAQDGIYDDLVTKTAARLSNLMTALKIPYIITKGRKGSQFLLPS